MNVLQDLRFAWRTLRRSPGFSAVAIASIALGIGANTAIFSVVSGVLLRPLPYEQPDRLYVVRELISTKTKQYPSAAANVRHYLEWRERSGTFDGLAAAYAMTLNLTGAGEPERLGAMRVSANFFSVLGVQPRAGRTFEEAEEQPGRDRVIVITDGLWRRRFGADAALVGRTVQLDGGAHTVIGILPESFRLPRSEYLGGVRRGAANEVFKPFGLDMAKEGEMGNHDYLVVGRLKAGISPEAATAELNSLQREIANRFANEVDLGSLVIPFQESVVSDFRRGLWLLMAAVFAVLLIVCANLANLMLVRALARGRELAIRAAIGCGRWQMVRLMLAESMIIAVAGGAAGMLMASWAIDLFAANAPAGLPRADEVRMDQAVLAFASAMSMLSAVLFGMIPALHALRTDPQEALRGGSHTLSESRSGGRIRNALVGCEVAASAVLLITAGLLTSSLWRLVSVEKGFSTSSAITAEIEIRKDRTDEERGRVIDAIEQRVATLPGVAAVAVSTVLPLEGEAHVSFVRREGDPRRLFDLPMANYRYVGPAYLDAMRMSLKQGRWFTNADRTREVVVLSERTAQTVFPGQDAVGLRIQAGGSRLPYAEVIGIVSDTRSLKLEREPVLMAYLPWWKRNPPSFALIARTDSEPGLLAAAIRQEVSRVDSEAVVARTRTLERVVQDSLSTRRYQLGLLGLFAASAFALATLGIYGVVSYSVARRRTELGIRLALGAAASDLNRLVLRKGMTPVAIGLAVGLFLALGAGRLVESALFGVTSTDPLTYGVVIAALLCASLAACYVPARRVTQTDPSSALRHE